MGHSIPKIIFTWQEMQGKQFVDTLQRYAREDKENAEREREARRKTEQELKTMRETSEAQAQNEPTHPPYIEPVQQAQTEIFKDDSEEKMDKKAIKTLLDKLAVAIENPDKIFNIHRRDIYYDMINDIQKMLTKYNRYRV